MVGPATSGGRSPIRAERILAAISVLLSVLCLVMAWQIIQARWHRDQGESVAIPVTPEEVTAWVSPAESSPLAAVYHREDNAQLRRAEDAALARSLRLQGRHTFLELLLVAGSEGLNLGEQLQVTIEDGDGVETGLARPVDQVVREAPGSLSSGARLLLCQKGGGGAVPAGRARKLLLALEGEVDLEDAGRVRVSLDGGGIELQRQDLTPGSLDQVIEHVLEAADHVGE